ncbi:MAG: YidC/Oxa1 family membrane protein insertase [Treponema sp.]|jgi:YidC/Oxa1 family membrane protein insertase|nr:YidC/Oxa1 family membrane protein insertase [Treponema sp.]
MIQEIFYTFFIWPIQFILEFLFVLFVRIFNSPGYAIIFLSVVVSTMCIPLFKIAERWQKEDRELQKQMKPKLDNIRSVYKGDKRQMIINTYYRQMGYSPVGILKSSMGLLLQVPFFIAAYNFLSNTRMLSGVSFLYIKDLGAPGVFFGINILPIIMTIINLISSFVYAKNLGKKDFIQLSAISLVFLFLLYDSPTGLVLYWTMNNLYSLFKNIANKTLKKPGIILKIAAALAALAFIILIISGKARVERFGILFAAAAVVFAVIPFVWKYIKHGINSIAQKLQFNIKEETNPKNDSLFYISIIILFLLIGVLNPAQVLSSSVSDFETPWLFLFRTIFQGFSFLVLIPLFIRAFSADNIRKVLSFVMSALAINALICYFALSAYYGIMDRNFKLDDTNRLLYAFPLWVSLASPLAALACTGLFTVLKKKKILAVLFQAGCAAILIIIGINLVTLGKGAAQVKELRKTDDITIREIPVYFPVSRTEKNVFIVFMDRAQGSAVTDALEYMPEFKEYFDGFVFYPNTISFGANTVIGVPSMLGGYDSTPHKINNRKDEPLKDKVNEAISFIPKKFADAGYNVVITDPVIANLQSVPDISIFNNMPNVVARLLSGKLTHHYLNEFNDDTKEISNTFDFDILFRYGLFRTAPPALRYAIYYKGQWWREAAYNSFGRATAEFSGLYYLPQLTYADNGGATLNILMNYITHEGGSYNNNFIPQNIPYEISREEIERWGSEENVEYIYTLIAGMTQLSKWFNYLKSEGIYDNTRIIIVSDHGSGRYKKFQDTAGMEGFNPLLMVKDFNTRGQLTVSEKIMTHSDTPYLAAEALGITGIMDLEAAEKIKKEGIPVFSAVSSQPLRHGPYLYNLTGKRNFNGNNVLERESWGEWESF